MNNIHTSFTIKKLSSNKFIEEIYQDQSEENNDIPFEQSFISKVREGDVVEGTITRINPNDIVVDIGLKSDGRILIKELGCNDQVTVGSKIKAYVERIEDCNGNVVLSREKAIKDEKWNKQIWVEIGFGSGENIFHQAQNHTDILLIGCEPYLKGVTKLLINIEEHDVKNILIWIEDARWLINNFQDNSIERFFIFFPDPWPKRNHHKRRLINYDFLSLLAKKMTKDILIATDHQNYAEWIKTHLQGCHFLSYKEDDFSHFPTTKYHQKAIDQGHKIRFFRASKY